MAERSNDQYTFVVDQAVLEIRKFNSNPTLTAADHLLHQHFSSTESSLDPKTIAERVVLLDAVWATQLFREPGSTERIIDSLARNAESIRQVLSQLSAVDLEHAPHNIIVAVQKIFPHVLHLQSKDGKKTRQNYSFTTKFFHWLTRRHFPIVDSKARSQINRMQREIGMQNPVLAAPFSRPYLEEYPRWIHFYSGLIRQLPELSRQQLLSADSESQPQAMRVEHSLLRVLDKVFYIRGGGTGLGQMSEN